jgi:hypothetical protein
MSCSFHRVIIKDLWCRSETKSSLWMRTRVCATRRVLVSRSLVMIHCGTTLMCDLSWTPPLKRFLCCLLKQSNNLCHHCWIKRSLHRNQNLSMSDYVIKITLFCVVSFPLTLVVTARIQVPFATFIVKVKPWSLFGVGRQLISSLDFLCCWNVGVCSFALSFNPCIPEPSQFISHEETDEQPVQMDFYPNEWSPTSKCELSTLGLPMGTKRTYSMSKVVQQVGFTNL